MDIRFDEKNVIITGASTGIGRATAIEFARSGAKVVINFYHSPEAAKEVVENMKISEATAQQLDQPFVPEDIYIEQANKYWDSRVAHYKENQK